MQINKRTWFLIGISLGLLIGIYISRIIIDKVQSPEFISIDFKKDINDESDFDSISQPKNKSKVESFQEKYSDKKQDTISPDTLFNNSDSLSTDSLTNIDSLVQYLDTIWSWEDTIQLDTTANLNYDLSEKDTLNKNISRDVLFEMRYIKPEGEPSYFNCDDINELDSILVDNHMEESDLIRVEFWKSPLNSRAYILTKSKLVLFGVLSPDSVKLNYLESGELLLRYYNYEFTLKCSDNLKPSILK